jgi:hypothetical protein
MAGIKDVYLRAWRDPQWESEYISKRPLRGPQAEIIKTVERFVAEHAGGVMTILSARQTGKNELSATPAPPAPLARQNSRYPAIWIRTAPTYKPQIVNSKKRLREILQLDAKKRIDPGSSGARSSSARRGTSGAWGMPRSNSSPQARTRTSSVPRPRPASTWTKRTRSRRPSSTRTSLPSPRTRTPALSSGASPQTASTRSRPTARRIAKTGSEDLNLNFPCDVWMDVHPPYRIHVDDRVRKLWAGTTRSSRPSTA